MEKELFRTVKYSAVDAVKFEKIALKLCRSRRVIFSQMVEYFYKSKKDPIDINDELLKNTLLKSHKDYIGFIKTQETELLIPIKREISKMIASQIKLVNCFNDQILSQNQSLLKNQSAQVTKFTQTDELMKLLLAKLDTKEKLKKEFVIILENYIKAREAFGMMTSGREKEELIERTKTHIMNL